MAHFLVSFCSDCSFNQSLDLLAYELNASRREIFGSPSISADQIKSPDSLSLFVDSGCFIDIDNSRAELNLDQRAGENSVSNKVRCLAPDDFKISTHPQAFSQSVSIFQNGNTHPEKATKLDAHYVASSLKRSEGIKRFLGASPRVKPLKITSSAERGSVIEAVRKAFLVGDFSKRSADKIARAVDELILNAIFEAPPIGQKLLLVERRIYQKNFALSGRGAIDFQIGFNGEYLAIIVADRYGTLDEAGLMSSVLPSGKADPNE